MTLPRKVTAAIACILILAAAATAEDRWKTVTLDGNPDFTVSIPVKIDDYGGGKKSKDGNLMFFAVTAAGHGGLTCMASREAYPKNVTQKAFAAGLASEKREVFCKQNGGSVSGVEIGGSTSFDHNGSQAAECTASYTDSAEKLPGRVESEMVIAAPGNVYLLVCVTEDEDQETAQLEWATLWEEIVRHIQKSFHVPK
ncbi:MAG: hypothetical protein HOP13_04105 [Alphaproteobacteria bacterium]|nr:hypothetical protein [Alphaproteobacteria bacterium]